jgi:hypothetical protein
MNLKTKLILATTAVALFTAPASARFDGDEGAASAYPRFNGERYTTTDAASAFASGYAIQQGNGVQRPRVRNSHPRR